MHKLNSWKSTYLEIEGQHKDYSVVAFICNDPQTWSQENGSVGLCAIHEVGFYTDHGDAWGCGLHSNCFGVFRMMHFADGAFLMRTHSGCPKKGYFLNYWTWHWLWAPAWFSKKLWTWSSPLSPSGQNILQIFFLTIHNHSLTSKICFELGLFKIHVKEFNYERKNGSKKFRKSCHWQSDLYPPIGGHHPVLYFTIQIFKHFSQKDSSIC